MANESGTWVIYGVSEDDPECIHTRIIAIGIS